MKSARNSWADHVPDRLQKEVYPGAEIPFVPVEPDVLDGGDALQGLGVDTLATGRRVRRVVWWFSRVNAEISNYLFLLEN
jgi:hypothetical protein